MENCKRLRGMLILFCLLVSNLGSSFPQEKAAVPGAVQVHVVITAEAQRQDSELPALRQDDVKVKQGKTFLQVTQLIPVRGDTATLQLFVLIDDTLDSHVGNNLNDIREFISTQPPTTLIGIGYMSNAGVNIVQNFTPDHTLAAKALRLPRGNTSLVCPDFPNSRTKPVENVSRWAPQMRSALSHTWSDCRRFSTANIFWSS